MILETPDRITIWTEAGEKSSAAAVTANRDGDRLPILIDASEPLTGVALRWDVRLPAHARILGDHWERGYGDLEWRGYVPERLLPWYALIRDEATGATHGFGVETGAASFASWRLDEQGITLVLDLRCGGKGVHLNRRVLRAATVRYRPPVEGESAYQATCGLCALLCPSPRLPSFPVYGGNDWYYAYGNNSDASIRNDAALIRELAPNRDNAPFMVIDAGWFPNKGCNGGPYDRGNERFPDMPGLASAMRAMDVRPGIWIRPLLVGDSVPDSWRLPETHPLTRGNPREFYLDPTVPEVQERIRADIARLTAWGYDLIKHDFTTYDLTGRWGFEMFWYGNITPDGWTFADNTRTTAEIIGDLYRIIREAAGDALLIGCNTVGHLGAGLFELQRTGDDTSGREWERTRKMGVNTLAFRMPQHNTFFAVDADCVGLTNHVPWEKNRLWLDLLARSGTPLFVSANPAAIGAEQRKTLIDAFAIAATFQPPAEPLDWLETTCPRHWCMPDGSIAEYNWI